MKKLILSAATLLIAALSVNADDKWDWPLYSRYEAKNAELMKNAPEDPRRVVFFGNSITEGWPRTHAEFFTDNNFVGRGISGQTTYQFVLRFIEDVINIKPALVVINAATNDVAENTCPYNEERSFNNIVAMVQMAQANGIKVILTSTLPAAKFGWAPQITGASDKIASLNKRIKDYADKHDIPYVDYYSALVNGKPDRALDPAYSGDGVHPNAEGYKIMEGLILPVVRKYVP